MDIRYYYDPNTDEPHIYDHHVTEQEVEEVLRTGKPLAAFRRRRKRKK